MEKEKETQEILDFVPEYDKSVENFNKQHETVFDEITGEQVERYTGTTLKDMTGKTGYALIGYLVIFVLAVLFLFA